MGQITTYFQGKPLDATPDTAAVQLLAFDPATGTFVRIIPNDLGLSGGGQAALVLPCGDRTTPIPQEDNVFSYHLPFDIDLTKVTASLARAAVTGTFEIDVRIAGASVFSTPLTIDAADRTSHTASVPAVIGGTGEYPEGSEVIIDVTNDADGTASGLIVTLVSGAVGAPLPPPPFDPLTAFSWLGFHDAETLSLTNGASVTSFTDLSGNDKHFVPDTVATQEAPVFVVSASLLNNKKAINFDTDQRGMDAAWAASGQCTVWLVGYFGANSATFQNVLWGDRALGDDWRISFSPTAATLYCLQDDVLRCENALPAEKYILRIEHRATETRYFLNGVDVTDDASSTKKPGAVVSIGKVPAWLAGFADDAFIGVVACSDGLITGANADLCEDYWAARYAITLP